MSWILGADRDTGWQPAVQGRTSATLLAQGTLRLEFDAALDERQPARLFHYASRRDWDRQLTVYLNADRTLSIETRQGRHVAYCRIAGFRLPESGRIALSCTWQAPARRGALTVEDVTGGSVWRATFRDPVPLPLDDVVAMTAGQAERDPRLTAVAWSDSVQPIGPLPGIAAGTPVETEDGPRPVEALRLGDRIVTAAHGLQPVRWIIRAHLPQVGWNRGAVLRAPYFGLLRDIRVASSQAILVSGADAQYLLGEDAVLFEAGQLNGHPAMAADEVAGRSEYYQLLLDVPDCISVAGTWLEALFVGRLAATPGLIPMTCLAGLPATALPVHARRFRPGLRDFAASSLRQALGA